MINLSTGEVQQVSWPGYPALFEVKGSRIVRLVFFSQYLDCWVAIVPQRSTNSSCLEIEAGDLERIRQLQASGFSPMDSFKRTLGV